MVYRPKPDLFLIKQEFAKNSLRYRHFTVKKLALLRSYFAIISEAEPSLMGEKFEKNFSDADGQSAFLKNF